MPDQRDRLIEDALRRGAGDDAAPGPFCLDAETAAAWVDGSLGAEELDVARTHAADCARCQVLMAALVATQPPATALVPQRTRSAQSVWPRWTVWAAPLATAALLLVAVMIWTRTPTVPDRTSAAFERAPSSAALPDAVAGTPPAAAPSNAAAVPPDAAAAKASEPIASPGPTVRRAPAPAARTDAVSRDTLATAEERLSKSASPAAPAPAPAAAVSADATGVPLGASRSQALNETISVATAIVVSSDPSVRWRIGGAALARSVDGGSTWTRADIPGGRTLTAGSAPSSTVCWIVGRGGVVLRTVDGTTWRPTAIPAVVDLTAIVAADARSATVTAADGRRFDTRDGGVSWTPTDGPSPR
jgi:hypothetical protein